MIGAFLLLLQLSYSDVRLQILHTGDIHSHFLNDTSPLKLGGVARLKHKMDVLRRQNENSITLDAGDWTEGSIFFILNSGEANHRIMETMGYDAIVFGNHDWLVGPQEVFDSFASAQMQVPVLSANIDNKRLPPEIELDRYIHPYIIKWVAGKKVGIFGLSTFDFVFDHFAEPIEVESPVRAATKYARYLKEVENCDVVIALTHVGIGVDKMVAYAAPEIDLIVGGHSHILLKEPLYVNGVPIVHAGKWGWYLGDYELTIPQNGRAFLTKHKIHQIDESIPEDPDIKVLVEGFQALIEGKWGRVWSDQVIYSDINLHASSDQYEHFLSNVAVDALREAAKSDMAVDNMSYRSQEMYRGHLNTADFFNLFPHNWSTKKDRAWNVFSFEIKGYILRILLNAMYMIGPGTSISNTKLVLDHENKFQPIHDLRINNKKFSNTKYYKVGGTEGVLEALKLLQSMGWNLHLKNVHDTGKEAWRVIQSKVQSLGAINRNNLRFEGRIRSLQPDLFIQPESVMVHDLMGQEKVLSFIVTNMGLKSAVFERVKVWIDQTPTDTLDDEWSETWVTSSEKILEPGESRWLSMRWDITNKPNGVYPVRLEVFSNDDISPKNNVVETFVYVYDQDSFMSLLPHAGGTKTFSSILRSDFVISN